jgi:hypothetical protein
VSFFWRTYWLKSCRPIISQSSTLFRSGERVDAVIKLGGSLRGHFGKFRDDFGLLGKHLSHAQSSYQSTERRLEQFGQRLLSADANQEFVEFRSYDRKMG